MKTKRVKQGNKKPPTEIEEQLFKLRGNPLFDMLTTDEQERYILEGKLPDVPDYIHKHIKEEILYAAILGHHYKYMYIGSLSIDPQWREVQKYTYKNNTVNDHYMDYFILIRDSGVYYSHPGSNGIRQVPADIIASLTHLTMTQKPTR